MSARAKAVVIGASAGALDALNVILPALPESFALPVVVVVHVPPDKRSVLSELFDAKCRVPVYEAEDKQPLGAGAIYFAPPDYHVLIERGGRLALSGEEPVLFSRPSIDVLFESAADAYGESLLGIVLTGANYDGARGLKAIVEAGGVGLVQNPSGAFAPAMPEAALRVSPSARALSLEEIAAYLKDVELAP